jgi:hypothetical protein
LGLLREAPATNRSKYRAVDSKVKVIKLIALLGLLREAPATNRSKYRAIDSKVKVIN